MSNTEDLVAQMRAAAIHLEGDYANGSWNEGTAKRFDRMIEQIKADAWDEGAEALEHHQMHVSGGWPTNPYRRQEEA